MSVVIASCVKFKETMSLLAPGTKLTAYLYFTSLNTWLHDILLRFVVPIATMLPFLAKPYSHYYNITLSFQIGVVWVIPLINTLLYRTICTLHPI